MKARVSILAIAAAATSMGASAQMNDGTYTYIGNNPGGEPSVKQILQNYYGGSWSTAPGSSYSNGGITATRLDDYGGGKTALGAVLLGSDQRFSSGLTSFKLISKNAGDTSAIGWLDDTHGGTFHQLFNDTGNIGATTTAMLSKSVRFEFDDKSTGTKWTTRVSDNVSDHVAYDQMITYRISGLNTTDNVYLMFFEDRIGKCNADYDYNDAVMEIRTCAVPAPASLSLLSASGLLARRRRR